MYVRRIRQTKVQEDIPNSGATFDRDSHLYITCSSQLIVDAENCGVYS